jgi:CRP-like cAMP-binding protein
MTTPPTGNLLFDSLSAEQQHALHPEQNDHSIGTVLISAEEVSRFVFFPHRGALVSIIRPTESGLSVESGVVGGEGLLHVQCAITDDPSAGSEALVQMEGTISRVEVARLRALFRDDASFRDNVLAFTSFYLEQLTQNLVCNRLHGIEQRLAKWLLVVRDLSERTELHLTQEFLSHMLGVHRPGVSIAIAALESDALIQHGRNMIAIRDTAGLERKSCECWAAICLNIEKYQGTFLH